MNIGTISYNIYCNFTNYGSALQTYALHQAIKQIGGGQSYKPILVDYCPEVLSKLDILNPLENMWDKDEESRKQVELSLPAIKTNYYKFGNFYHKYFDRTKIKYTSSNFEDIKDENINRFVCGSDTIFCIDEFKGFDDGYYANYPIMKHKSVSYAASFGDSHFDESSYKLLNQRLNNFLMLGIRENQMIPYIKENTSIEVSRTIDPTLLLTSVDYDKIASERIINDKYLLLYSRRYNSEMEKFAEKLAEEKGWKIVEISLRATNANKPNRIMMYEAGVEEFLSLVKYSEFVVTNSFHGLIFTTQYRRPFYGFTREQCDTKIEELMELFGVNDRLKSKCDDIVSEEIDFDSIHKRIEEKRIDSIDYLKRELNLLRSIED